MSQPSGSTLVLFNLEDGEYYSLNEVAARAWALCDGSRNVADVVSAVAGEYEVDPDLAARDVTRLLAGLVQRRLLIAH